VNEYGCMSCDRGSHNKLHSSAAPNEKPERPRMSHGRYAAMKNLDMRVRKIRSAAPAARLLFVVTSSLACLVASGCSRAAPASPRYGLPISLGLQREDVRKALGGPNEIVKDAEIRRRLTNSGVQPSAVPTTDNVTEWYYSSGIVATFEEDRLFAITLPAYTSYPGFVPYSGQVVNGVRLTDAKPAVLSRLGHPAKVEDDPLPGDTDLNVPEVWPKESRYYWRFNDYLVRVTFLKQAQKLDDTHVLAKDAVVSIGLNK
jgi:hypothetical protein